MTGEEKESLSFFMSDKFKIFRTHSILKPVVLSAPANASKRLFECGQPMCPLIKFN